MNAKSKKKGSKKKQQTPKVELSEELKNALGDATDIVLEDTKLSKEEKKRQRLKEEKRKLKMENKGKRARKLEEIAVSLLISGSYK